MHAKQKKYKKRKNQTEFPNKNLIKQPWGTLVVIFSACQFRYRVIFGKFFLPPAPTHCQFFFQIEFHIDIIKIFGGFFTFLKKCWIIVPKIFHYKENKHWKFPEKFLWGRGRGNFGPSSMYCEEFASHSKKYDGLFVIKTTDLKDSRA